MPGFASSVSNNIECVFAANADFSTANNSEPNDTNGLQQNGQLWIGRTAVNGGGTHIDVNTLTAGTGISITNGPGTITIAAMAGPGAAVESLTPDTGGVVTPSANNINLLGSTSTLPSDSMVTHNFGGVATMGIENRRWLTAFVVDPSATVGSRGTYTTISAASTAASSGDFVFIRDGTYTEDVTVKPGVTYCSFVGGGYSPSVTVVGKWTMTSAGTSTISGIRLKTNSDFCVSVTGANLCVLNVVNCFIEASSADAIQMSNSNADSIVYVRYCTGSVSAAGNTYFAKSGANSELNFSHCILRNEGGSTKSSTVSDGTVEFSYVNMHLPVDTSSNGTMRARHTHFRPGIKCGTIAGNVCIYENCTFRSLTAVALTITSTASIYNCSFLCTNATMIDGAGTLTFGNGSFEGSGLITTTSQIPLHCTNNAVQVKAPGAYPYTAVPQDAVILVDTSSARTINLNASPVTGQTYRIKDNVGSAAANNITITPAAGNIDGSASATISSNYGSVDVCYNGSMWVIL